MTITVSTIVDMSMTPTTGAWSQFATTACAKSGDWLVAASNVGDAMVRVHLPTNAVTIDKPFAGAGVQSVNVAAVRPNGNVCIFRGNGEVYEVVPSTGAWTSWTVTGAPGGITYDGMTGLEECQAATVGENAYFGGYGTSSGPVAAVVNMSTHAWTSLGSTGSGINGWYSHSIVDPAGTAVWLIPAVAGNAPWRIALPSHSMTQPVGAMSTSTGLAVPFLWDGLIWESSNTTGQMYSIDPVALTMALGTASRVGYGKERNDGTLAALTGVTGGVQAERLSTPTTSVDTDSTLIGASCADGGGVELFTFSQISYGGVDYTRITRITFDPDSLPPTMNGFFSGVIFGTS